ncbi:ABC-three component system middle component 1 [Flavobacterium adhaerens]|uniref:ABC-three component system middle component 1 n=1 Tax=Flavobacterium adhaerens TaxID=3149043 RepID=UPI0032B44B97
MIQLLKNIFKENNIIKLEEEKECFSYENKSFFFNINIQESELLQIRNTENFYDNGDYKRILDIYRRLVDTSGINEIEKNSSLIVTVKCEDLESLSKLQQQILLIEENEYFFKKYVILYTDQSISQLSENPTIEFLQEKLNDFEKFDKYSEEGYISELAEYMVVLQLFIKLPFLKLAFGQDEYFDLTSKLKSSLLNDSLIYERLLLFSSGIEEIDFTNHEDEKKIGLLFKFISND